jgi:serine/threonine-protein kinase
MSQACDAVGAAHQRGIVHRDLKPSNLFLVAQRSAGCDDVQATVKVLDFGIAKLDEEARSVIETQPGALVGTPSYMAPERLQGGPPNPSWDLWSLAVITYELLTGVLPFDGDRVVDLRAAILGGRLRPVSGSPGEPTELDLLFAGLFAVDPGGRPTSAYMLTEELRRGLLQASAS